MMHRSPGVGLSLNWIITASLVASAPCLWALGFRNPDQSARATAQGEAFVAQADDPSAIYYNPGGMTQLEGTQSSAGSYLFFPNTRFEGVNGGSDSMSKAALIPHVYTVTDFGLKDWRFGLGVTVPYGNAVKWDENGPFRYTITKAQMAVYNIAPTIAYKINDHLSIGAGVNIYHGETALNRFLTPFVPNAEFRFDGEGNAVGATAGALYKINDQHSLGLTYRSPFSIDFDGTARVRGLPNAAGLGSANATTTMEFPQQVAFGYAFRPMPKLKLEADIEWTNWDTMNTIPTTSKNATFNAGTPMNWQDSFFYELGAEYKLTDNWAVRAGYIYSDNTVPTSTFSPMVVDGDRHIFSVGGGFTMKHFQVDLAYQYTLMETRDVNGSMIAAANGTWRVEGHAVMLTGTLKF